VKLGKLTNDYLQLHPSPSINLPISLSKSFYFFPLFFSLFFHSLNFNFFFQCPQSVGRIVVRSLAFSSNSFLALAKCLSLGAPFNRADLDFGGVFTSIAAFLVGVTKFFIFPRLVQIKFCSLVVWTHQARHWYALLVLSISIRIDGAFDVATFLISVAVFVRQRARRHLEFHSLAARLGNPRAKTLFLFLHLAEFLLDRIGLHLHQRFVLLSALSYGLGTREVPVATNGHALIAYRGAFGHETQFALALRTSLVIFAEDASLTHLFFSLLRQFLAIHFLAGDLLCALFLVDHCVGFFLAFFVAGVGWCRRLALDLAFPVLRCCCKALIFCAFILHGLNYVAFAVFARRIDELLNLTGRHFGHLGAFLVSTKFDFASF